MHAYLGDVVAIAFTYVRREDVAADVAQEVFIRVWERREGLDPAGQLSHYLRRAARNAALNVLARDAAAARLAESLVREFAVEPRAAENAGAAAVEGQELDPRVRDAIAALSPRVREIVLLYIERGMEPGEIATLLSVAPQTVYNQLSRAMKTLALSIRHDPRG